MFQPQPTPFSPFSPYGINISPQPQPQPPPPLLDFNNYQHNHNQSHNHNLNQSLNHNHNINNHNHNSISNSQPLHHQLSQSHSHSHPHPQSLAHPQRSNSLPHCSSSAHTPPATATIVDNLVSIVVANQPGQGAAAGRGLGNTLQQFQPRHPQQPIFSPVNNNAPNSNSNPNVTGTINISHNSNTNPSLSPSFAHHNQQQYKMEDNGVNDLEAQEALARDFQPALVGPLVGDKMRSTAITEEYAKADPIYVSKTSALPQKYSHYRPILGDGNCGWRAAVFSYFETLLRMGNRGQVDEELARMMSLNNLLTTAGGFDAWLFEDMVEETTSLLRDVADLMDTSIQAAKSLILDRFNNSETSNAIVYHCRLLASSWLKANPQNYQGFIPDGGGIDQYRKDWLEPPNQEIDHLGMTLLIDVLLKPAGFAVEIVYLDRSEGTQVNSHMFQAEDPNGQPTNPAGPIIYLLYRPGHYDILYKDLLRQSIEMSSNIQVNRATNFTHQHSPQANPSMNAYQSMDLLFSIPGLSLPTPYSNFNSSQYQSPMSQSFAPTPSTALSTALSPMSPTGNSASTPQSTTSVTSLPTRSSFTSINTPTPIITSPHPFQSTQTTLPIHTLPPPHPHAIPSPTALGIPAPSFRPSKYEWAITADLQEGPVPSFQTSTFKNSHYNTAHYNNPNFQPEEWTPEEDGLGMGSKGGGGAGGGYGNWARKRSS